MSGPAHNAYTQPRQVREGCQHQLGCKCDTPYHLRESTPAEGRFEARAWTPTQIEPIALQEPDAPADT